MLIDGDQAPLNEGREITAPCDCSVSWQGTAVVCSRLADALLQLGKGGCWNHTRSAA